MDSGNYASALDTYEQLLSETDDDSPIRARLHYNAGTAAYKAKEYDKAEANFRKALNSPRHPCPYSNARFITSATRCFGSARKPRIRMIKSSSGPER